MQLLAIFFARHGEPLFFFFFSDMCGGTVSYQWGLRDGTPCQCPPATHTKREKQDQCKTLQFSRYCCCNSSTDPCSHQWAVLLPALVPAFFSDRKAAVPVSLCISNNVCSPYTVPSSSALCPPYRCPPLCILCVAVLMPDILPRCLYFLC